MCVSPDAIWLRASDAPGSIARKISHDPHAPAIGASGVGAIGGVLAALFIIARTTSSPAAALEPPSYHEAPMLRKLVEQGKLPPVQQRLPAEPAVVSCLERTGVYGGRIRIPTPLSGWEVEAHYFLLEPLVRFDRDGVTIVPNVAKGWNMSPDGRSITLQLRKGMRWSDGVPVTVDDVLFAWNDVLRNKDITPVVPEPFIVGGEPMKLDKIDPFTFRLTFKGPYGSVLYALTRTISESSLVQPKHYLQKFHPKYTPMNQIVQIARQRGFQNWFELFRDVNHTARPVSARMPPDYPTLSAWHPARTPGTGSLILQRNPYYWKIDPDGNQLPYIDEIHSMYVGNPEARNLMAVAGQFDFCQNHMKFGPMLLSGRRTGHYSVRLWLEDMGTRVAFYLNQTHPDRELRKVFQDRRFRIALSLALNRKEINKILYYGKCIPRQSTVMRNSTFFEPHFETAYAEYDPARANRLLDKMGLQRKGIGRWRHLPDGRQIVIKADIVDGGFRPETAELAARYWSALGVLLNWRVVHDTLVYTRLVGNMLDVVTYPDDAGTDITLVMGGPGYRLSIWAPLWARWFTSGGDVGEKPPAPIKELWDASQRMRSTPNLQERTRLGKWILQRQAENLYAIGTVGGSLNLVVVSDRLHNVPGDGALMGWSWLATALHFPEQFYLQEN